MSTSYTWWSNAVNRTSLSRFATCRIRSSPRITLARPCVRRATVCREFLLASSLPSIPSATGRPALFEDFLGSTELSDCSRLFIIGVRPQTSRCTPPRHQRRGDSSSPGSQPRCFHACVGVSDLVGSQDVWRLDDTLGVALCSWDGIGTPISRISRLNTRPTCAPTNAWHPASRQTAHGSGSVWFANLYRTTPSFATPRWFIPALPHVPHQSLSQA